MVPISLFATGGSSTALMGVVDINLAEVLLFPQNKIQLTTKVMSVLSNDDCEHADRFCGCGISVAKPKHLGNLTLWFRLTCELDVLKSLFTDFDQWRSQKNPSVAADTETIGGDVTMLGRQQEQHQAEKMTATRPIEQSDKHVVPTKSSTQSHDQPTMPDKNSIAITIDCLKFNESFQLPAPIDTQIHVECNFLGSRRLKTPPQPLARGIDRLRFNFTQAYPQNERNLHRLSIILKDPEHSIKFTLIETKVAGAPPLPSSSPPPSEKATTAITSDDESKHDCNEIGFGLLHFGKFVSELHASNENANETLHTFSIPILSKKPPYQNIGQLDIAIANISMLQKSIFQQQN